MSSCTRHGEPQGTHKSVCVELAAIWFFGLVHPPPHSFAERLLTFPGTCLLDTRGGRRGAAALEGLGQESPRVHGPRRRLLADA